MSALRYPPLSCATNTGSAKNDGQLSSITISNPNPTGLIGVDSFDQCFCRDTDPRSTEKPTLHFK